MSNKLKKRNLPTVKKKKTGAVIGAICGVGAIAVILGIAFSTGSQSPSDHLTAQLNESGDFVIAKEDIGDAFYHYDYGGEHDVLIWKDESGTIRTAFNTCEECFSKGNARYEYQNGKLVCQSCRNELPIASFGNKSWGGCQPVAVPVDYRTDTEELIVIPSKVMTFADDMFAGWENGDFTVTLESYSV